jgi:adsorption protein B
LKVTTEGILHVGVCSPLPESGRAEVTDFHAGEVEQFIVTETEMTAALQLVATGETVELNQMRSRRLLGDVLIEMRILSQSRLAEAVRDYDPKEHGRLGDYLVAKSIITTSDLERALLEQREDGSKTGQLVNAPS